MEKKQKRKRTKKQRRDIRKRNKRIKEKVNPRGMQSTRLNYLIALSNAKTLLLNSRKRMK